MIGNNSKNLLSFQILRPFWGTFMIAFNQQFCFFLIALIIALLGTEQTSVKETRAQPATTNSLMQCMEKCVKYEGNTSTTKSTCKMRCANVSIQNNSNVLKINCMGNFKECRQACPKKDKRCQRKCKEKLNRCS